MVYMIIDKVENMPMYYGVNAAFEKIYAFLAEYKASPKPDGKYELDGDRLFVSVSSYDTVSPQGRLPEAHRKYADVQVMLSGRELIGWAPLNGMKQESGDLINGDCAFFSGGTLSNLLLDEDIFALFMPQDAHMPCLAVDGSEKITKAVFKVLLTA